MSDPTAPERRPSYDLSYLDGPPGPTMPVASAPYAYDDRGNPVYAPDGYGYAYGYALDARRPRRGWDLVLTILLLVVGVGVTIVTVQQAGVLSQGLDILARQHGLAAFTGESGQAATVIVASQIGLLAVAIGLSIPLLVDGRPVVFWIPLVAGIVAAIVFWAALIALVSSDPALIQAMRTGR